MTQLGILSVGREDARGAVQAREMTDQPKLLTLRVTQLLMDEADKLVPFVAADVRSPLAAGRSVTRSDVLRLALIEGFEVLRRRYGLKQDPR